MLALFATLSYVLHSSRRDASDRNRYDAWDGTLDSGLLWGMIYYNPADAAVLVKNRFGLGWALNFGNPQAKLWCGGMLVLIAIVLLWFSRLLSISATLTARRLSSRVHRRACGHFRAVILG